MKIKLVILLILLVLFTIFVIQNIAPVTVTAYFWNFSMALSLLMVIIAVIGIILGLILAAIIDSKKKTPVIEEDKTVNQIKTTNPDVE